MLASSLLLFLVAVASICATLPAVGASSSIVVSANVPSATRLNRLNCAPGSAGRTDFGVVQPGSSAVTSLSCDIEFGSSNATSSLRIRQADEHGRAMWTYGIGQLDGTFDGAAAGNGVVPIDALSSGKNRNTSPSRT